MKLFDATQTTLYIIIVFTNSVYTLAALFLPTVFLTKDVAGVWVGLVFAAYSMAVVAVSPFIGKILKNIGFANLVAFGLVCMGISIIPFGYFLKLESPMSCVALGIVLRVMQGTASAAINSTCYSLAADKYPEQTEAMVGLLEAFSGLGGVAGLLGGAYIYESMGYQFTFLMFGGMLPVVAIISRIIFGLQEEEDSEKIKQPLLGEYDD